MIDVPFYEFKEFVPKKEGRVRVCLREAKVVSHGTANIKKPVNIEHIWVSVKDTYNIDASKPIRVVGIPYEYAHKCGKTTVKNIGINILTVLQNVVFGDL